MRTFATMVLVAAGAAAALAQTPAPNAANQAPVVPTVVKVGDMAPDFTLEGSDGRTHRLSEYRGKTAVVLAWFPKAFTGGCTTECKSLAENGSRIREFRVTYFMASTDNIGDQTAFARATTALIGALKRKP